MGAHVVMSVVIGTGLLSNLGVLPRSVGWWVAGAPRVWRDKGPWAVRWIGGAHPDGEEATLIREAIRERGLQTYGEVTSYVAEHLFRRDYHRGGWVVDMGLFRGWYLLHACQSLDRLEGRLVQVEHGGRPCSR